LKKNIDAENLLNEMIADFEAASGMKPSESVVYKSMLFGSVKFAVKIDIIKKSTGEKMLKKLEEICDNQKEKYICQE